MQFLLEHYPQTDINERESYESYPLDKENRIMHSIDVVINKFEYYDTMWIDTSTLSFFNFAENLSAFSTEK